MELLGRDRVGCLRKWDGLFFLDMISLFIFYDLMFLGMCIDLCGLLRSIALSERIEKMISHDKVCEAERRFLLLTIFPLFLLVFLARTGDTSCESIHREYRLIWDNTGY